MPQVLPILLLKGTGGTRVAIRSRQSFACTVAFRFLLHHRNSPRSLDHGWVDTDLYRCANLESLLQYGFRGDHSQSKPDLFRGRNLNNSAIVYSVAAGGPSCYIVNRSRFEHFLLTGWLTAANHWLATVKTCLLGRFESFSKPP